MNRYVSIFGWTLVGIVGFLVLYIILALSLSRVPVNSRTQSGSDVQIFIMSNGVHTDIVVPIKSEQMDWSQRVKMDYVEDRDSSYKYLAFGWGDRAFYLETPTWADLTFQTAFSAALGLGKSAMHTTFYRSLKSSSTCFAITISKAQYAELVQFIQSSFQCDEKGQFYHIRNSKGYGSNDAFYEAHGRYSMLHTCNTWTNNALKSCKQKAAFWTPFDKGILWHYEE